MPPVLTVLLCKEGGKQSFESCGHYSIRTILAFMTSQTFTFFVMKCTDKILELTWGGKVPGMSNSRVKPFYHSR